MMDAAFWPFAPLVAACIALSNWATLVEFLMALNSAGTSLMTSWAAAFTLAGAEERAELSSFSSSPV
jgi:uncharacterized ion transporter superfamily protein YfcC